MEEETLALCRAMGADPDGEELLLPLIRAVSGQLAGRLRTGIVPRDCGPAFPLAAAMLVMDRLSGMTGGLEKVTSFTAGELTIRRETGNRDGSSALSAHAEGLLGPWLRDSGFVFQGVEG